jgi:hypothetical protein
MSRRKTILLKLLVWTGLLGLAVAGIVLLSGMLVGLIIGGFTMIAVLYDSATFGSSRPRGVIVGEIDQDFGSTTQKLHDI